VVLNLEMRVVRELLSREEIQVPAAPSDSPGMATGETTVEFLSACYRLLDVLGSPQDIPFLGGLIQRQIIYRILLGPEGARLRGIATLGAPTRPLPCAEASMSESSRSKTGRLPMISCSTLERTAKLSALKFSMPQDMSIFRVCFRPITK
jgi:hypothetical protein